MNRLSAARDQLRSTLPGPRRKYGNLKPEWNGIVFDSKGELNRWLQLNLMQEAGQISELRRQVKFDLCPPVRLVGERQSYGVSYTADFGYVENSQQVYEDWKGLETKEFRMKRRLLKHLFGIDLRLTGKGRG